MESEELYRSLPPLAAIARGGYLFRVAQSLTATIANGAQFVLFNGGSSGRRLWVFSALASAAAAMQLDLFDLIADPALTAGGAITNCMVDAQKGAAVFEAQVTAQPAKRNWLAALQAGTGSEQDLIGVGGVLVPPGRGLLVSSAAVAGVVGVTLVWAELTL